jgi:hypothetical protein
MTRIITALKVYTNWRTDQLQTGVLWIAFLLSILSLVLFWLDPHYGAY